MKHHPDKGGDPEKFKQISHAYDVLSDEQKKSVYDQTGSENGEMPMPGGGAPFDMFMNMFGGRPQGPNKRATHEHTITVTLDEAFHNVKKTLKVELVRNCFSCMRKCEKCQGQGMSMQQMGFMAFQRPCQDCQAAGFFSTGCPQCHFQKVTKEYKDVVITITPDSDVVVCQGLGEQAKKPEEIPGDLIIRINIRPHKDFLRQGRDLLYKHKMSFVDSVNGTLVRIPHFDGEFQISTQDFGVIDPRQKYKVPGKGMKHENSLGAGDMYIVFDIEYPPSNIRYVLSEGGVDT